MVHGKPITTDKYSKDVLVETVTGLRFECTEPQHEQMEPQAQIVKKRGLPEH